MVGSGRYKPGHGLSRRGFLSLAGGLLAAAALAACDSTPRRTNATSTPSPGKQRLAQWYHQYGEAGTKQAVERYAKGFARASVTVQWTPGDYAKTVADALVTDSGPDIFEAPNGPTIDQIQAGQVLALDGVLGAAQDDFTLSLLDRMTYKGKLYAVPQVMDMQLLVYRKSLLKKAGIKPPTTFGELVSTAAKLTTKTTKGLFIGNDGGVAALAGPMLWSVGADYLTSDGRPGFDNPEVAAAFGKLHDLFRSGSLLLGSPTDWADPAAFTRGRTAMQWTGLWTFPELQSALGDDFGVLPWPRHSASLGNPSVPIGAYGAAISAKSKHPQAAKDYLTWLWVDQTDKQLDFAQSYGFHIPARGSLSVQAEKLKSGAAADAVKLVHQYGKAQTPLLWTPASGAALDAALTKIITDGADAGTQLKIAKGAVVAELKRVVK
jgi:multiple sugar transport system substrate-binding protein